MPGCTVVWLDADPAQLGRPIGGEHDERHAGVARLEHRRVQVGDRGARGGDDDDRDAGLDGEPEGEEPADRSSMRTRRRSSPARSNWAAASASACDREPGLSTTSRTPRRTNSPSSAVANALAGDSLLGLVIVEVGEFLLELADALLLLLLAAQVAQESGVVIGRDRAALAAATCPTRARGRTTAARRRTARRTTMITQTIFGNARTRRRLDEDEVDEREDRE